MELKFLKFTGEFIDQYWDGAGNIIVRFYAYLDRGLALFNQTKNYVLLIFASYWTIKTMDIWISYGVSNKTLTIGIGVAAFFGIVFLVFLGRWYLFRAQKAQEFINARHGTITGWRGFNMQVFQVRLLMAMAEKMGVDVKKLEEELEQ